MAYAKMGHEGHTLEIQREVIDVTPMAEPDPGWTFTDRAGHTHGYTDGAPDGPYTTLEYRTVHDHADDGECDADGDQEFCYPVLVCKRCAQPVRPGTRAPLFRQNMPGMTTYLIDGEPVSKQAAEDFMAASRAEKLAASPEEYHGIPVPESVRLNWAQAGMWKAGVRAGLGLGDDA